MQKHRSMSRGCTPRAAGVDRDDAEAERWFQQAAAQGDAEARLELKRIAGKRGDVKVQWELALFFLEGEDISKDEAEAAYWLELAAEQGCIEAQFRLGHLLIHGAASNRNSVEGVKWFAPCSGAGQPASSRRVGETVSRRRRGSRRMMSRPHAGGAGPPSKGIEMASTRLE